MKPFSLLVKPASWRCNLRCRYCFYLKKEGVYDSAKSPLYMSDEVLKTMLEKFMRIDLPVHGIGWQGGEPTLMGLDFFKRAVHYQQKFGSSGKVVSNGLQTNGTLLDDTWCRFLKEYNFLVGLSIDGPPEIHDINRLTPDGRGSHRLVMRGLEALQRNQVEFNVLTLVNQSNQDHPLLIYNYLKELGVNYQQYIECVEFGPDGELSPFAVDPIKWGEFLCAIFDEWYEHDVRRISIRLFDSILTRLVDNYTNVCAMGSDCRQYFVVEHNGDVYPCDFFVEPELRLGNIMQDNWEKLAGAESYREFGKRKQQWNEECTTCQYLMLCAGCCPKNRPSRGKDPTRLSVLCPGWKIFYQHALPRLQLLAEFIRKERIQAMPVAPPPIPKRGGSTKIGRNAPCPCGSGKKYKKCCGA